MSDISFFSHSGYQAHTNVSRVVDGAEPMEFKALFKAWRDKYETTGVGKKYSGKDKEGHMTFSHSLPSHKVLILILMGQKIPNFCHLQQNAGALRKYLAFHCLHSYESNAVK